MRVLSRLFCHCETIAINASSSRTPSAVIRRCFCHTAMEAAKSLVPGSLSVPIVLLINRSYRYQPRCCLPPKVHVSSLRNAALAVAAVAKAAVLRVDELLVIREVVVTEVFSAGRGD